MDVEVVTTTYYKAKAGNRVGDIRKMIEGVPDDAELTLIERSGYRYYVDNCAIWHFARNTKC